MPSKTKTKYLHFKLGPDESPVCGSHGDASTSARAVECAKCLSLMLDLACDRLTLRQWRAVFGKARCRLCGRVIVTGTVCRECLSDETNFPYLKR